MVEEEEMNMGGSDEEVEVKHDTKKDIIKAESDEDSDSDSSDEEMDEEAIQRRRDLMRQKAALKAQAGLEIDQIEVGVDAGYEFTFCRHDRPRDLGQGGGEERWRGRGGGRVQRGGDGQ